MGQYLSKFAGTIGKRQSEQIMKLLNKRRNSGQIRSVREFTQKLEELMRELTSTTLQPTASVLEGEVGDEISSERHNFMLDRVEDDLSAAFEEANNISEAQKSHETIIKKVILKNLRAGVAELEAKVDLFEFLNKDASGFDKAIFSTFRESKNERTHRRKLNRVLFRDPRKHFESIPVTQNATIDLIGERLILPSSLDTPHTIHSVEQLFDSDNPSSERIVKDPVRGKIENIIDNKDGTYWTQYYVFRKRQPYIKVKLEFDFGAVREINKIEIEPARITWLTLESVHYYDDSNVVQDLGIEEKRFRSDISVSFPKIATDKFILTFRDENAYKKFFQHNQQSPETEDFTDAAERKALGPQVHNSRTGSTPTRLKQLKEHNSASTPITENSKPPVLEALPTEIEEEIGSEELLDMLLPHRKGR